jgi:hypothetical protein
MVSNSVNMIERYGMRYVIFSNAVAERFACSGHLPMPTRPLLDRIADELLTRLDHVPLDDDFPSVVDQFVDDIPDTTIVSIAISMYSPPSQMTLSFSLVGLFKLFMLPKTYESFVGDLEDRCAQIAMKQGHRSAQLWFWQQVVQSLFPLVFTAIRRVSGWEKLMGLYWRMRS